MNYLGDEGHQPWLQIILVGLAAIIFLVSVYAIVKIA